MKMARNSGEEISRRSDQIRARRAASARKSAPPAPLPAKRRTASPSRKRPVTRVYGHEGPPVLVRTVNPVEAPAARKTRRKSFRRRYDIPLGVPGAEMSLPALPEFHLSWKLLFIVLLAGLAAGLYYFWNSPFLKVQVTEMHGLSRIAPKEVTSVLEAAGKNVLTLDTARMEQELAASFPEFSHVQVQVAFPDTLAITVTERVPVLTWQTGEELLLVDSEGMAFPMREGGSEAPQPVVQAEAAPPTVVPTPAPNLLEPETMGLSIPGISLDDQEPPAAAQSLLTPEMVAEVLTLAANRPQDAPLAYTAGHGFGWTDAGGWQVYFGQAEEIQTKLRIYQAIVQRLNEEGVTPVLISVEHTNAPYYRLEP